MEALLSFVVISTAQPLHKQVAPFRLTVKKLVKRPSLLKNISIFCSKVTKFKKNAKFNTSNTKTISDIAFSIPPNGFSTGYHIGHGIAIP
jgi:hypothetical protein